MSNELERAELVLTPWGYPDNIVIKANGMVRYVTASHGGYFLPPSLNAQVPAILKDRTFLKLGNLGWYEEDEDWAIVALFFPEVFDLENIELAIRIVATAHSSILNEIREHLAFE